MYYYCAALPYALYFVKVYLVELCVLAVKHTDVS